MASKDLSSKKTLNGDSPVFTPGAGHSPLRKSSALPLQAANAAPFTPRGSSAVSTSGASSSASPREQLRDLAVSKEPAQIVPRADASSFNLAAVREFVPRGTEQAGAYSLASTKEFQPKGDRSPFNVAKAVEFRPQSQVAVPPSATPTSTSSVPSQAQPSPQASQQSLHMQQSQHVPIAAQQQQQQQHLQALPGQAPHMNIPTGPAQGSQMTIPTGPSRGANHSSNNPELVNNRAGNPAAIGMAGVSGMPNVAYGMPPGSDAQLGQAAGLYDAFNIGASGASAAAMNTSPYNPYATTSQAAGREGTAYFQGQPHFGAQHQPPGEHLYFPQGPHRQDLLPRQRTVHDFFLPEKLRQDVHMKARAGNQAALTLQVNVESYHSLTPLDTNSHKVAGSFGRITWLYKAVASKNGKHYCLRRVENFRVSNENALRAARDWRRVNSGSVVTVHEAFTTRAFGDSSVVFAMDYFPLSVTLMQYHFPTYGQNRPRGNVTIQETILWGYFVQIATALRAIHSAGLAARSIDLTKIIRTGKNRIRLSGCAVQDVINYDPARRVLDLQQDDFVHFGEVMFALATYTPPSELKRPFAPLEQIPEIYSHELKAAIAWLLTPPSAANPSTKNIESLISGISTQMTRFFDMSLQENDGLTSLVFREVENGRVARMLMKLGTINERENYQRDATWAEHGPRYPLKLFRDYVFHQVDEAGRPVIDVWHMLSCLNKLDAGSNDVVRLSSRDGRTNLFVTYKELNKMVQRSFNDLLSNEPVRGGKPRQAATFSDSTASGTTTSEATPSPWVRPSSGATSRSCTTACDLRIFTASFESTIFSRSAASFESTAPIKGATSSEAVVSSVATSIPGSLTSCEAVTSSESATLSEVIMFSEAPVPSEARTASKFKSHYKDTASSEAVASSMATAVSDSITSYFLRGCHLRAHSFLRARNLLRARTCLCVNSLRGGYDVVLGYNFVLSYPALLRLLQPPYGSCTFLGHNAAPGYRPQSSYGHRLARAPHPTRLSSPATLP